MNTQKKLKICTLFYSDYENHNKYAWSMNVYINNKFENVSFATNFTNI